MMGAASLPTRWGLSPIYGPNGDDYMWLQFGVHPGIVNFAFADGSVHAISQTADYNAFVCSSGMADHRVFDSVASGD